jgi:DNA-binding Xre family transcriptional regulator
MDELVTMPIRCTLRLLVARQNVERVSAGQPELTQQRIADESGVPLSVVSGLITNRVKRVDYGTLDKLCRYFKAQPGDLLVWEPTPEEIAA